MTVNDALDGYLALEIQSQTKIYLSTYIRRSPVPSPDHSPQVTGTAVATRASIFLVLVDLVVGVWGRLAVRLSRRVGAGFHGSGFVVLVRGLVVVFKVGSVGAVSARGAGRW